jgi:hypothetical protein
MEATPTIARAHEAERLTLGSIIAFPGCAADVFPKLHARDFLDPVHAAIYTAMLGHRSRGLEVDPPLLAAELKNHPAFDDHNPGGYMLELGQQVATVAHIDHYTGLVRDAARKRYLRTIGEAVIEGADNGKAPGDIVRTLLADVDEYQRETSSIEEREKFTFAELRELYPRLNPPVVDGLFRAGETINIISTSKVGKSWLGYSLALSIITGKPWLGRFETDPGRVLLIDNELHRCTLAHRIPVVADAMGIPREHYQDDLEVWSLRGNLRSLDELTVDIMGLQPGDLQLILCDAKYRFAGPAKSENDNATETALYNLLDQWAEHTGAAIGLIHHSTKGSQADKRVTDVGAGAGAQSRAADCHLVLREHEDPDVVVLEAAVRSFAPVEPMALRWVFPLWKPTDDVDPQRLKGKLSSSEQRQAERDKAGIDSVVKALLDGPATARALRARTGFGKARQDNLLNKLMADGHIVANEITIRGNTCHEYKLAE